MLNDILRFCIPYWLSLIFLKDLGQEYSILLQIILSSLRLIVGKSFPIMYSSFSIVLYRIKLNKLNEKYSLLSTFLRWSLNE